MSAVNQNSPVAWRRAIKIGLYTKRKLGFIEGIVLRSITDANLSELWDTCNNMVICWILGYVMWSQLVKRFALSDGSRKYKLNKDTYAISQSGGLISEYLTKMKCVWEEMDNVNVLPPINVTLEISVFLTALSQQKEWRLIQFSNGLDEHYGNLRSQLLAVDGPVAKCRKCMFNVAGRRVSYVASPEKCWEKVGYPSCFTSQPSEQLLRSVQMRIDVDADDGFCHKFSAGIACLNSQLDMLEDWIYDTDLATKKVKGLGKKKAGLYHLVNVPLEEVDSIFTTLVTTTLGKIDLSAVSNYVSLDKGSYGTWHHRLGHVSD
ncbi:hypothetical protein Tco_1055000 [Tanacetum coccineum]|uniref:GAG-pre-integrase domain-containing protein n=1 Tax=Tanacetum coccineum TaxID=301880 RepID=A0ABQ5GYD8_9ASTR